MKTCFVCNGRMHEYFVKHEHYAGLDRAVDRHFIRCEDCGLVIDKTGYEMSIEDRSRVNDNMLLQNYEHDLQEGNDERNHDRIKRQSLFVYQVLRTGVIHDEGRIVDYGCATGELVKYVNQLREAHSDIFPRVFPYDRYYAGGGGENSISLMMK